MGDRRDRTTFLLLRAGVILLAVVLAISIALLPLPLAGHAPYALMIGGHLIALALVRRGQVRAGIVTFAVIYLAVVLFALGPGRRRRRGSDRAGRAGGRDAARRRGRRADRR